MPIKATTFLLVLHRLELYVGCQCWHMLYAFNRYCLYFFRYHFKIGFDQLFESNSCSRTLVNILFKIYLIFQTKTAFRLNSNICLLKQSAWRYYSRVLRLIRLLICRLPSLRPSGENRHFLRLRLSIERCMEDGKTPSVVFSRFSEQRRFRECPATILTNCVVLFLGWKQR